MTVFEDAVIFLLKHVKRHGDTVASATAAQHLEKVAAEMEPHETLFQRLGLKHDPAPPSPKVESSLDVQAKEDAARAADQHAEVKAREAADAEAQADAEKFPS